MKREDAPEEPKEFWYIEGDSDIHSIRVELCDELEIHTMKQIGNYFETEEEAEKAVEKLKAWKRLKEKGVYFTRNEAHHHCLWINNWSVEGIDEDLDLLFGGKE